MFVIGHLGKVGAGKQLLSSHLPDGTPQKGSAKINVIKPAGIRMGKKRNVSKILISEQVLPVTVHCLWTVNKLHVK